MWRNNPLMSSLENKHRRCGRTSFKHMRHCHLLSKFVPMKNNPTLRLLLNRPWTIRLSFLSFSLFSSFDSSDFFSVLLMVYIYVVVAVWLLVGWGFGWSRFGWLFSPFDVSVVVFILSCFISFGLVWLSFFLVVLIVLFSIYPILVLRPPSPLFLLLSPIPLKRTSLS